MSDIAKIFVPCRHGIGDVLSTCFSPRDLGVPNNSAIRVGQLFEGRKLGFVKETMAIYERHRGPSVANIWPWLGIMAKATFQFKGSDGVAEAAHDNQFPDIVHGHCNLFTNRPDWWDDRLGHIQATIPCPVNQPQFKDLPAEFVVFTDGAGDLDRALTHPDIIAWIKEVTDLPIIRVGQDGVGGMGWIGGATFDWSNSLDLTEALWLAKNAEVIVAPASLWRVTSSLFGTKVIELLQADRAHEQTQSRTRLEYETGKYGMTPELNRLFVIPTQVAAFQEQLEKWLENH